MALSTDALLEALDTVVSIPVVPFDGKGNIDYAGHAKNIDYLLDNNHLDDLLEMYGDEPIPVLFEYMEENVVPIPGDGAEIRRRT